MERFSTRLSSQEKSFFSDSLEKYNQGKIPLSVNLSILKAWIIRFGDDYLAKQTFFKPYPEELQDIDTTTTYCESPE
jgi:uncharacterized protein YbgA (DUF1722 family)